MKYYSKVDCNKRFYLICIILLQILKATLRCFQSNSNVELRGCVTQKGFGWRYKSRLPLSEQNFDKTSKIKVESMKIGYPCINLSLGKKTISTFRLSSYSEDNLIKAVNYNLSVLEEILRFNIQHNFLFFRISSDIIPFASHPTCKFDWQSYFKNDLFRIGRIVKENKIIWKNSFMIVKLILAIYLK